MRISVGVLFLLWVSLSPVYVFNSTLAECARSPWPRHLADAKALSSSKTSTVVIRQTCAGIHGNSGFAEQLSSLEKVETMLTPEQSARSPIR